MPAVVLVTHMRSFFVRDIDVTNAKSDINRLETPFMAGFRAGMSSCSVIGRKLGAIYRVPSDRHDRIETLIEAIDHTVKRGR